MPTYDYRVEATQNTYEVQHSMAVQIENWGQLCAIAGINPGSLNPDSAVTRLISSPSVVKSSALRNPEAPPCMSGASCCGGGCGLSN